MSSCAAFFSPLKKTLPKRRSTVSPLSISKRRRYSGTALTFLPIKFLRSTSLASAASSGCSLTLGARTLESDSRRSPPLPSLSTSVSAVATSTTLPWNSPMSFPWLGGTYARQMRSRLSFAARSAARSCGASSPVYAQLQSMTRASPTLTSSSAIEPCGWRTVPTTAPFLSSLSSVTCTSRWSSRLSTKKRASRLKGSASSVPSGFLRMAGAWMPAMMTVTCSQLGSSSTRTMEPDGTCSTTAD
mmetsp:Transcript_6403/g.14793  ORF Transcript_6403/g.14793 Transcript_6403/m.14793 type:complete len:244 (+) Transcript_6403:451-1182(+)